MQRDDTRSMFFIIKSSSLWCSITLLLRVPAGSTWSFLELQHELIEIFILLDTIGNYCVLPQWIYGALLPLQSLVWMPCLPLLAWVMWFVAGHGCVRPFSACPHVANLRSSLWPWCPVPVPGSLGQGGHLLLCLGVVGMSSWLDDLCCWGFALFVRTDVLHRLQVSMLSAGLSDASCPASWMLLQSSGSNMCCLASAEPEQERWTLMEMFLHVSGSAHYPTNINYQRSVLIVAVCGFWAHTGSFCVLIVVTWMFYLWDLLCYILPSLIHNITDQKKEDWQRSHTHVYVGHPCHEGHKNKKERK